MPPELEITLPRVNRIVKFKKKAQKMNVICSACAEMRSRIVGEHPDENIFNRDGRVKSTIGLAQRSFICFDCGHKMAGGTAAMVVHVESENAYQWVASAE